MKNSNLRCILCGNSRSIGSEWYCRKCFRESGVQKGIKPTIMYDLETCSDNSDWYFVNDCPTRLHGDSKAFDLSAIFNNQTRILFK